MAGSTAGVAVAGCGSWGRNIARCFAELGALAAVVDRNPAAAEAVAAAHGCRALGLDAALADPAVAAVAVATQPRRHHEVGMAALAAGKHVLVEKPLALDLAEAEAMVAAARAGGRVLMVGHILRYHPAFVALQGLVAAGRLGRIRRIQARRLNLGAVRGDEDALWCLAPHDVSMILALAGAAPARVDAFAEHVLGEPPADAVTVRLGFDDGATALIEATWLHPIKEHRLTVIGTEAMAVFDDRAPWERKLTLHPDRVRFEAGAPVIERDEPVAVPVEPGEPLMAECRHFLDCIAEGREPLTGAAEALAVMNVLARASRAVHRVETETAL